MVADPELPASWRKTFMTLWLGCFMTGLNFSMTMPFMALYIETLHPYGKFELNLYAGLAFAVTYLAQLSPPCLDDRITALRSRSFFWLYQ